MRTFLIAYLPAYISLSSVLDWTIVFIILSIMWNIAASSKILREWSQEKQYYQHKRNIKKMKSVIKLKQPKHPGFVYEKPKLQMARRDRLLEIARQNDILVKKMNYIYGSKHPEDKLKGENQWLKTLNHQANTLAQVKIDQENKKICERIMHAHTHYPTFKIIHDSAQLTRTSLNISANARRFRNLSRNSLIRPQSTTFLDGSRFVRSGANKQNRYEEQLLLKKSGNKGNIRQLARPVSAPSIRFKKTEEAKINQRVRTGSRIELSD